MTQQLLFWVFAILSCGGAIAVVLTQNVVRMAFWLVVSLGSVAALFFLLHADFLGAAQLLIYVGGTVVLLVFGVMLTASGPFTQIRASAAEMILGSGVGLLLLYVLVTTINGVGWSDLAVRLPTRAVVPSTVDGSLAHQELNSSLDARQLAVIRDRQSTMQQGRSVRQLGLSFLGLRPDRNLKASGQNGLTPGYLLPFEIVSIHLLVVLIGAAYLARAKRRVATATSGELG